MVLQILSFFKYSFIQQYPRYGAYYGANVALENTYEQSECTTRAPNGVFATVHTSKKGYAILQMLQKYFKFA